MTNPDELPLEWFHDLQRKKLSTTKNVAKDHWLDMTLRDLFSRLIDEMKELGDAMIAHNAIASIDECVDVANFCVMLAHKIKMESEQ